MRTLLIVLLGLLPASTFASVGDMYVCKRTEVNNAGYIDEFVLTWRSDFFEMRWKEVEGSLGGMSEHKFDRHTQNFFTASYSYQAGHILASFDGKTFAQVFVDDDYTYVSEYSCPRF